MSKGISMRIVFWAVVFHTVICPAGGFSLNDKSDLKNTIIEYRKTLEAPSVEPVPWEQKRGLLGKLRHFVAGVFEGKGVERAKTLEAESKTQTQLALSYIAIAENLLATGKKTAAAGYIDGAGKLLQMRNDSHAAALATYSGHLGKAMEREEHAAKISAEVGIYSFKIANMLGGDNKAVKHLLSIAGVALDTAIAGTYKGSDAAREEVLNGAMKLVLERLLIKVQGANLPVSELQGANIPLSELIKDPKKFNEVVSEVISYLAQKGTNAIIIKDGLVPVVRQNLKDIGESLPKIGEFADYASKPENRVEPKAETAAESSEIFITPVKELPPTTVIPSHELVQTHLIDDGGAIIPAQEIVQEVCDVSSSSPDCN